MLSTHTKCSLPLLKKNRGQHLDCPQHAEYPLVCGKVSLKDSRLTFLKSPHTDFPDLQPLGFLHHVSAQEPFHPAGVSSGPNEPRPDWTHLATQNRKE